MESLNYGVHVATYLQLPPPSCCCCRRGTCRDMPPSRTVLREQQVVLPAPQGFATETEALDHHLLRQEKVETSNRVSNPGTSFLAVGRLTQSSAEVRECGGVVADRRTAVAAVGAVADLVTTAKAALL